MWEVGIRNDLTSGLATSIDPKGYLTSLDSQVIKTEAEIAPGWIAAAALEEHAGRMVAARKLIKHGCEQCPKSEDIWLEAARLHERPKVILADAVQHVGQSVKVWLAAADLENDPKARKRVLRRALEHIPNSVRLWKETVNLETSPADARTLLSRAVEVIPLSVELWLALARLESPENAKAVLNKARKAVPTSHEIWIATGRLIEQEAYATDVSEEKRAEELEPAVRALRAHGVLLTREQWLKEAERCEAEARRVPTVAMDVEEEDRLATWLGTKRPLKPDKLLARAVECCPQAEVLWLMWAKEKWLAGDVPVAREVLARAFVKNSESEQIWLAAVKLEAENGELTAARELLVRARTVADTERVRYMDEIGVFERQQGQAELALQTVATALSKYPKFAKLYMIHGQILLAAKDFSGARAAYAAGLKAVPKDLTLWADGKSIRARALIEKARLVNPKSDLLWAEASAKALLARALQDCPSSAYYARPQRKARSVDALKKCADDPLVICTARQWFDRAVAAGPDIGDAWAWWIKFERQHGSAPLAEDVATRGVAAEPHHGETWQAIAKDDGTEAKLVAAALQ
ncbi:hypothetical protein EI94DRAFT_1744919 [Lactarius quietus]|nr:hypothetical protein EI94DRAFT_1744919 [Lactarius quietus]